MSFAIYLIFLACLYLRPFELFAQSLMPYRPMLALSVLCVAVALGAMLAGAKVAARGLHFVLMSAFATAIAASLLLNANGLAATLDALVEFSFSFIVFAVTVMCVNTLPRLRVACLVLALSLAGSSVAGIAGYYDGFMAEELVLRQATEHESSGADFDPEAPPADDETGVFLWRVRSLGFLADPNDFAQMLVAALPLLLAAWRGRAWLRGTLLVLVPAGAMVWATYLTHSRGAILAAGVVVLIALRRKLGWIAGATMLTMAGAAAFALDAAGGRSFSGKEESAAARIDAWSEGISMFKSHPILGVGYGNFSDRYELTAHNSFVLCFAELGLLGYLLWIALIVVALGGLAALARRDEVDAEQRKWGRALGLSVIGFLVCAWFLSRAYQPGLYTLLGLAVAAAHLQPHGAPVPAPPWVLRSVAAGIAAMAVVYFSVMAQHLVS